MSSNVFLNQLSKQNVGPSESSTANNIFLSQIEGRIPEPKEGLLRSIGRSALQVPLGVAKRWTWPADLAKMAAEGGSQDILTQLAENEPELRGGVAEQARQKAMQYFPTQSGIEEAIEEKTGIPLTPKNKLQKAIRLGSEAASFRPGGMGAKATAGVTAPAVSGGLQALGAPEWASDIAGFAASGVMPEAELSKIKKPSGLTTRRFEKTTKPTKITPGRYAKINSKLEDEFRGLTENILKEHPNYESIRSDPEYRTKIEENFGKVRNLAENIKEPIYYQDLIDIMKNRFDKRFKEIKGITPSESEEAFKKEFGNLIKKVVKGPDEFSTAATVDQFRKNNSELAQYFEPGKSQAYNTGKRDALLEYNRAIEDLYQKLYPDSEFTKLFNVQNKHWSELCDVGDIDRRLEKIFSKDKIDFNQINKILDKGRPNYQRPFKRIMGEKGFSDFETLLKDLRSVQNPYSLLKKAELGGFRDLAKVAASFLLHPSLSKAYVTGKLVKEAFKMLLDKPQVAVKWKSALDALKSGDYEKAESGFKEVEEETKNTLEKTKAQQKNIKSQQPESAKKINEEQLTDVVRDLLKGRHFENEPFEYHRNISQFNQAQALIPAEKKVFKKRWDKYLPKNEKHGFYDVSILGSQPFSAGKLKNWLKFPRLKKMLEKVGDIDIAVGDLREMNVKGYYDNSNKQIVLSNILPPEEILSTLVHEGWHALQFKTGKLSQAFSPTGLYKGRHWRSPGGTRLYTGKEPWPKRPWEQSAKRPQRAITRRQSEPKELEKMYKAGTAAKRTGVISPL